MGAFLLEIEKEGSSRRWRVSLRGRDLLLPTFPFLMAPRSRSSSESSHDSESPRKRAPSCSDAEGETDAPGSSPATTTTNNNGLLLFYSSAAANEPPRVTPGCVHIGALLGSTTLVHNYEKAVRWAARSRGGSSSNSSRGPPRKRRKACRTHAFTVNDTRPDIRENDTCADPVPDVQTLPLVPLPPQRLPRLPVRGL